MSTRNLSIRFAKSRKIIAAESQLNFSTSEYGRTQYPFKRPTGDPLTRVIRWGRLERRRSDLDVFQIGLRQ